MRPADVDDGAQPGTSQTKSLELRQLRRRNRLLEQDTELTGDPDKVVTETSGVRPGRNDILPPPSGPVISDVIYSCGRP